MLKMLVELETQRSTVRTVAIRILQVGDRGNAGLQHDLCHGAEIAGILPCNLRGPGLRNQPRKPLAHGCVGPMNPEATHDVRERCQRHTTQQAHVVELPTRHGSAHSTRSSRLSS